MSSCRRIREQDGWGDAATELRQWGINFWSDLFKPAGEITDELTCTVIEVMEVSQQSFEYRTWKPTVEGMITAVGRQVEWTALLLQSNGDCWEEGGRTELQHLSHRILAGPRQGAGAQR